MYVQPVFLWHKTWLLPNLIKVIYTQTQYM